MILKYLCCVLILFLLYKPVHSNHCRNVTLLYSDLTNCINNTGSGVYDCPNEADINNYPLNLTTSQTYVIKNDEDGSYIEKGSIIDSLQLIYNSSTSNGSLNLWISPPSGYIFYFYNIRFQFLTQGINHRILINDQSGPDIVCNNCFDPGILQQIFITMDFTSSSVFIEIYQNSVKVLFNTELDLSWETIITIFDLSPTGTIGKLYHLSFYLDHIVNEIIDVLYIGGNNYTDLETCVTNTTHESEELGLHCFGILATDPFVCMESGDCIENDNCSCTNFYSGNQCETFDLDEVIETYNLNLSYICYGFLSTDPLVCLGNGICIGDENCSCADFYSGSRCETFELDEVIETYNLNLSYVCYELLSTDITVCNGHGQCLVDGNCSCCGLWSGNECEIKDANGWFISTVVLLSCIGGLGIILLLFFLVCTENKSKI